MKQIILIILGLVSLVAQMKSSGHPKNEPFFNFCAPVAVALPDAYQHFSCVDVNRYEWEVLLRRKQQIEEKKQK